MTYQKIVIAYNPAPVPDGCVALTVTAFDFSAGEHTRILAVPFRLIEDRPAFEAWANSRFSTENVPVEGPNER